jgi:hypothetical protein
MHMIFLLKHYVHETVFMHMVGWELNYYISFSGQDNPVKNSFNILPLHSVQTDVVHEPIVNRQQLKHCVA